MDNKVITPLNYARPSVQLPAVPQKTIAEPIHCKDVGIHTGQEVTMRLLPAPTDTGIIFVRRDRFSEHRIPVRLDHVVDVDLNSCLQSPDKNARVYTVEHLMATLAGIEIDNIFVEVNGDEIPAMDGSAEGFVSMLDVAGIQEQNAPRRGIYVKSAVRVEHGSAYCEILPSERRALEVSIDFKNAAIGKQSIEMEQNSVNFRKHLCRARTFGFLEDIAWLYANGLALGGSKDNAIVLDHNGVLPDTGLRYDDEFVRHKALDLVGDLYLAGMPIIGRIQAHCPGHRLNIRLVKALMSNPDNFEIRDMSDMPTEKILSVAVAE